MKEGQDIRIVADRVKGKLTVTQMKLNPNCRHIGRPENALFFPN